MCNLRLYLYPVHAKLKSVLPTGKAAPCGKLLSKKIRQRQEMLHTNNFSVRTEML